MIHEEICTYEVCKLAKEKGFPQRGIDSNKYWFENFNGIVEEVKDNVFLYEIYPESRLARQTTQSLMQRWLREEKNIDIAIVPLYTGGYSYIVYNIHCRDNRVVNTNAGYDTYELALEDALAYSLKNLV